MKNIKLGFLLLLISFASFAGPMDTLNLNGTWLFEQTEKAIAPTKFSRKIPVPGLVHMAVPKITQYDLLFRKPEKVVFTEQHSVEDLQYAPRYNWYYKKIKIDNAVKDQNALLTIMKSMFVTRVFVNGIDVGSSMECYTPIEFPITKYLKFGQENEILIQVGDRAWLPSEAAGSTDKEKINYLPGIWDNVFITFSGKFAIQKMLLLPSLKEKKVNAKVQVRSFYPPQLLFGTSMFDSALIQIDIKEKISGKVVGSAKQFAEIKRDNVTVVEIPVSIDNPHLWTPDDPFLYSASIKVLENNKLSQEKVKKFGMREFKSQGKFFTLNGEKTILRGTNITLHRFFEDPECQALPWDKNWVKKLLVDIPKENHWNMMRICVGIVPDFWYDIADEYGLMFQNEWLYWQNHGWDEQIRKEYTNWVWSDGNHPSIVIWDGINENWDPFIGQKLIPELKKLDNTRMWDAGFMTANDLGSLDEMDEPHPYVDISLDDNYKAMRDKNPYPLGDLDFPGGKWQQEFISASVPQLVNEYGWMWLWRNGSASKLTVKNYDYYLGEKATNDERRELQAYWLQAQTEWLRSERSLAGVMQFCYLTNDYGFTGDAFIGSIKDLTPSPMLKWFKHAFAPSAAFIDLTDERYMKHLKPHAPSSTLNFNVFAINDHKTETKGNIKIRLLDSTGKEIVTTGNSVQITGFGKTIVPFSVALPDKEDGYLLISEYTTDSASKSAPIISRRYIKVGKESAQYRFFEMKL
jgi:beta-galactosidase